MKIKKDKMIEQELEKKVIDKIVNFFLFEQSMTPKKLQKLAYYVVAWYYTIYDEKIMDADIKFEAWVHGPVNYSLYNRYKYMGYRSIPKIEENNLSYSEKELEVLKLVYETYGEQSANQLEILTHAEAPWQNKRRGLNDFDSSSEVISYTDMKNYYTQFLIRE